MTSIFDNSLIVIKFISEHIMELDKNVLVFNRIPKTGSENMAFVIKELSKVNNFSHIRYGNPDHRLISRRNQVKLRICHRNQK